jgi:hypothetical protein
MKINKLLPLIILFFAMSSVAQDGNFIKGKKDKIKAIKIAYITNELSLTSDEATKFWPLFNSFEDKQNEIRKQKLKGYLDRTDDDSIDKLSDKEATTLLAQMESTEDELYQLKKKFIANLKGVISPIKILKLKKAEEGFNRKLLQQYRDKRKK